MIGIDDLLAATPVLQRTDLEIWIRQDLLVPRKEGDALLFSDMECARVRLICTLHYEMEIEVDTLSLVLSLVDQLYDTRQRLLSLSAAIAAQAPSVQSAIIGAMNPAADTIKTDKP